MSTPCTPITIQSRIQSYLSDGNVSDLELADLGYQLHNQTSLSADDAIAVADLLDNHRDQMSPWSGALFGMIRQYLPEDMRITLDAGSKAKDGRLSRADVIELLSGAGKDGFSDAELRGLKGVLDMFGSRFDPDAKALLEQGLRNANTCADTYRAPERPKLFGIF